MDYDDESNDSEAELDDVQRLPSNVVIEEIKEETEVVATEQGASARVARQVGPARAASYASLSLPKWHFHGKSCLD